MDSLFKSLINLAFFNFSMKVVVTGGAGFIGSHVVDALLERGDEVTIVDNLRSTEGSLRNIEHCTDRVQFIEAGIYAHVAYALAFNAADYVIHLAALRAVLASMETPHEYIDVNIDGTLRVLETARDVKIKRVVFSSSSSVYGDSVELPQKEGKEGVCLSPYAFTKKAGEELMLMFNATYGLETVCLRYFNVFGPRQDPESRYATVIPKFILHNMKREPCPIYGDGEQTRDFTYVSNVVEGTLKALTAPKAVGRIINLADGEGISVNRLHALIQKQLGVSIPSVHEPAKPGEARHTRADNTLAKELLGYEGRVGFEEGLGRTVDYFLKR